MREKTVLKLLKWAVIVPVGLLAFVMLVGLFSKPKTPKQQMEKAAKDCYVQKAQARMPDTECRAMESTARGM